MKFIATLLLSCLLLSSCGEDESPIVAMPVGPVAPSEIIPNTLEQIRNDMALPHEAIPRGVPEWMDWREGPRTAWGNDPDTTWSAMITWGQVYATVDHPSQTNTRFQIRNLQTWYLSKSSGEWVNWQSSSDIGGANYAEDFQGDVNEPANLRREDEGTSATLKPGFNFHFWVNGTRAGMDPTDIAAVWTSIDARLIVDDPAFFDDRSSTELMMSAGADYWESKSAVWDEWKTNGDIAIGRFRFITKDWQTYNMHTMSEEVLENNPPPF